MKSVRYLYDLAGPVEFLISSFSQPCKRREWRVRVRYLKKALLREIWKDENARRMVRFLLSLQNTTASVGNCNEPCNFRSTLHREITITLKVTILHCFFLIRIKIWVFFKWLLYLLRCLHLSSMILRTWCFFFRLLSLCDSRQRFHPHVDTCAQQFSVDLIHVFFWPTHDWPN